MSLPRQWQRKIWTHFSPQLPTTSPKYQFQNLSNWNITQYIISFLLNRIRKNTDVLLALYIYQLVFKKRNTYRKHKAPQTHPFCKSQNICICLIRDQVLLWDKRLTVVYLWLISHGRKSKSYPEIHLKGFGESYCPKWNGFTLEVLQEVVLTSWSRWSIIAHDMAILSCKWPRKISEGVCPIPLALLITR